MSVIALQDAKQIEPAIAAFASVPNGGVVVTASPFGANHPAVIAALAAISGINIVIGGFWDEMWHRSFGLPFGDIPLQRVQVNSLDWKAGPKVPDKMPLVDLH